MPQPRGYNPDKHASLPYVDKQYKELLGTIAEKNDWTKKRTAERAIIELGKLTGDK